MKRIFYMHTLDGKPAGYTEQVGWVYFSNQTLKTSEMATSLRQLRRQQEKSKATRADLTDDWRHGYKRIAIDC